MTDAFLDAVRQDAEWQLVFPLSALGGEGLAGFVLRRWTGALSELQPAAGPHCCAIEREAD